MATSKAIRLNLAEIKAIAQFTLYRQKQAALIFTIHTINKGAVT
jgi:hypothetical protein